ncbi:thiamine-phosphate kinase [Mariprofundus erugo]|uniref:Thiamine-monophosphate kinase n=1 Tax=Mariprofundus erugo TaxID=2528639 RepID=A0A5R9GQX4_9PROT|nr:thiamine-phosphate kinase [Mariprofundus erugo]TLS67988.1 thiamine-phosphate kinase [Mariprofundus erugo]
MTRGEFDLISDCFAGKGGARHPFTRLGIGDDASVHRLAAGMELVVSTDSSLAGIHWPDDLPLSIAADRAVCSALSDLAAMGAEPVSCWLNVMATDAESVAQMGEGATAALARYGVELTGGDTTRSRSNALAVTVAGALPEGTAMRRDMANSGDLVWLCGRAGFHASGLHQWLTGEKDGCFVDDFKNITPLLADGIRLRQAGVRCCMDISDGLLQDASHIARASSLAMEIEMASLPGWTQLVDTLGEHVALQRVAYGGEDYALLCTAPEGVNLPFAVKIGRCFAGAGVTIRLNGQAVSVGKRGYDHFG